MDHILLHRIDNQRRLCIQKDLKELNLWLYTLEQFNNKLDCFIVLEKRLIQNPSVENLIKALRRKNVLLTGAFCKYSQDLKIEFEYGKTEYNEARAKLHDKRREQYKLILKEFTDFETHIYKLLMRYKLK
ncbi:hypothetical protein ACFFU1_16240 [Algibacter miyuki]|uniref:Uncharacterized protein n=1 Tax=Algibacter miyuki TaxID=1306933 RepID=A0ABV5H3K2_9FLAO|nr:hypothetical protein [Algibacter miyuki]MDN3665527.1 hypothetical protein [Algibacter miyuki]